MAEGRLPQTVRLLLRVIMMHPIRLPKAENERRGDTRYPCGGFYCPVTALAEKTNWEAVPRDLSHHGIGLVLDQEVRPGKILSAQLFDQARRRWQTKTMRVVHVRPDENGWWLVGCSFAQPLADEEFWATIDEVPPN